jgi:hypothetical protein
MRARHDAPLPGDLVIIPVAAPRFELNFARAVFPHLERTGSAYVSYGYALQQAHLNASRRHVQVWRLWPNAERDLEHAEFENVTSQ